MQITFLGTSSGIPTHQRNVSSVALQLPQRAEMWLFDCGEGTQHQLLRSQLKLSNLTRIFITHMHGDHTFGLMGLLASAGLRTTLQAVDIYGPPELTEYLRGMERTTRTHTSFPITIHRIQPGVIYEDAEYRVTCGPLKHRIPAFGYRVDEKDRPGSFKVEKAKELGIPSGPLYGRLKRGETITLPDGRSFDGKDFCEPPEKGRSMVYCTDTMYTETAVALAQNADVLIHEATYAVEDEELAVRGMHSTTQMAARTAREANVRQLILTHFSPRYAPGNPVTPADLLAEAQRLFPHTQMAFDFLTHEIPRRKSE
ncbi:MAG: ribonuclease Z [Blastocatellia bacterium]|nr:ribonuclease Z [Blastocatellia bacterium]